MIPEIQQNNQELYINDKRAVKIPNPFTGKGFIRFDNPNTSQRQLLEYFTDLVTYVEEMRTILKEYPNDYELGYKVRLKTRELNEVKDKII